MSLPVLRQDKSGLKVEKQSEKNYPPIVGRSKAVLIKDDTGLTPIGIVSNVVARLTSEDKEDRLIFRGPVRFKNRSKRTLKPSYCRWWTG